MKVARGDRLFDDDTFRRDLKGIGRMWSKRRVAAIRERDHGRCIYCGELGNAIDHIFPYRFGGPTIMANGAMICRDCNLKKGSVPSRGFIAYGLAHLLRSGEDVSWVAEIWKNLGKKLDQAMAEALTLPAGEHWKFLPTQINSRTEHDYSRQADNLKKARAAVRHWPKGFPTPRKNSRYYSADQLVDFTSTRYSDGQPISTYDLTKEFGLGCRQTANAYMDYLVENGQWRNRQTGERIMDRGCGRGKPPRTIIPIK